MSPHSPRSWSDPLVGLRPRGLEQCRHRELWIVVRVGPDVRFQYCPECVQGQWWSQEDGPIDRSEAGLDRR